jgi:tetratricopeptide (TPR) repeat protein
MSRILKEPQRGPTKTAEARDYGFARSSREWVIGLLLLAALLVAYWPALHGGFLWDDDTYISADPVLLTLSGLRAIWADPSATCQYYPLSFTLFWTIHHFFGFDTFAYHLATLLLHGIAAIFFWKILECLRLRGALLAAAIFALHPVNVMSVAWMTELKNTLSCSLALGAAWAYLRFAGVGVYEQLPAERRGWRWYVLSLALFQLAMLAKTAVSFLPVSLLLVLWWQRERLTRRDVLSLLPMLGISVGMGALTIYIERHAGGASGPEFNISFLERVLISGRSFWFYLFKLVWPDRLTFVYPHWKLDPGLWWQWLYPVATVAVLLAAWLARKRLGKGPFVALMHFYISTSALVLAVVLYMMRYSFVADHWAYFGSLGIIALGASAIMRALDRIGGEWKKPVEMGVGVSLLLFLGILSRAQSAMYSNIETLWDTTISNNPDAWMAHANLGVELDRQGRLEEAMSQYREALRINPADEQAHYDLGNSLLHQGRSVEAIAEYREAIEINPAYANAHTNLGQTLFRQGQTADAVAQYRQALQIDPSLAEAHTNLGIALLQQGRTQDAIAEHREALRINPEYADAHNNLANALLLEGQSEEAIDQYQAALRINPDLAEAHYNLANALLRQGQTGEAIAQLKRAFDLQPRNVAIENSMAWMLATAPQAALRDGARAVELAEQATRATGGGNPIILRTLAAAYAQAGRFPDAVQTAQKALELAQANSALGGALLREIKLYQAGQPIEGAH